MLWIDISLQILPLSRFNASRMSHAIRGWISLMGMNGGATAYANSITARQLSLAYGKGRRSFDSLLAFPWNGTGIAIFRKK